MRNTWFRFQENDRSLLRLVDDVARCLRAVVLQLCLHAPWPPPPRSPSYLARSARGGRGLPAPERALCFCPGLSLTCLPLGFRCGPWALPPPHPDSGSSGLSQSLSLVCFFSLLSFCEAAGMDCWLPVSARTSLVVGGSC